MLFRFYCEAHRNWRTAGCQTATNSSSFLLSSLSFWHTGWGWFGCYCLCQLVTWTYLRFLKSLRSCSMSYSIISSSKLSSSSCILLSILFNVPWLMASQCTLICICDSYIICFNLPVFSWRRVEFSNRWFPTSVLLNNRHF